MQELDVVNVRELEDFLINECMYAVIILSSFYLDFSRPYIELTLLLDKVCLVKALEWVIITLTES